MPEEKRITVTDSRKEETQKKKKVLLWIIISAVVVIGALVGIIIYLLLSRPEEASVTNTAEPEKRDVVVTEENVEQTAHAMEQAAVEYTPPGYYTVTQSYHWTFPSDGGASPDAYIENDPGNTNDVYFDLFLDGEEDLESAERAIYRSPVIPIGGHLDKVVLSTRPDPGTYDCVMVYHLVDDDQNTISTVSMAVTVTVE